MKKMKLAALALSLVGILAAGNATAADTATVDVSATILATCSFDTTSYTMAFGNIDPTDTGDKTASVNLALTCTNGTAWTLDDVSGAQTLTSGSGPLAYSIDAYTLSGTGTGATQNVLVTGRITEANYEVAAADVYADSRTINVNP